MTWWNFVVVASYLSIIVGSAGMIILVMKYPFSTRIQDLEFADKPILGLNGKQLWIWSWSLIMAGMAVQFLDYIVTSVIACV